jgi:O-antigen ligase
MVDPAALSEKVASIEDAILYKGKAAEGVLGSRRSPWEKTVSNLRQHSWFGTGYGTSLTGEDPGLGAGRYSSSAETSREHGSSYMAIAEWVGLAGLLPFVLLIGLNAFHILRVGMWLLRTGQASHYSVPLAMVLVSGSIHAGFEDWMFAVGSYLCVYFWVLAFLLTDLVPSIVESPLPLSVPEKARNSAIGIGVVAPGR